MRVVLTDNSRKMLPPTEALPALRNLANRSLSQLLDEQDSRLLAFPHSFGTGKEADPQQCVLGLQEKWNRGRCTEMTLQTGNLMGFIGTGNVQLAIHSRFAEGTDEGKEDYFLHYMLCRTLALNLFDLKHTASRDPAFDFLLFLFPRLLGEALRQGLYKAYQWQECNDDRVRGAIDLSRHLRLNLPFDGRIAYRTRAFSHDNPVTQLVRHTLEYIRTHRLGRWVLQGNAETQAGVLQIVQATPSYRLHDREQVVRQNLRPVRHPYFTAYRPLQQLCLQILRHDRLRYGTAANEIYGILFDGAWLWEEYLATLLEPAGFRHPQNRRREGAVYLCRQPNRRYPRYPDFYDREEGALVLDAKYKREIDTRDDMNQMVTYLYRLKGRAGAFVLPVGQTETGTEGTACLYTRPSYLAGYGQDETPVNTCFFPIPQHCRSFKEFAQTIKETEEKLQKHYANASILYFCNQEL